uniref:Uncharacterized protein n=1 Tax=Cannabis sativa TaxID=3483 RepID=A0A803PYC5_CANSA
MDDIDLVAQAKTRVDGDLIEVTNYPAKTTQCNEKYVDENPINKDREEDLKDKDPEDDGKDKDKDDGDKYNYEIQLVDVEIVEELTKIKRKLAAQEEFSRRMQATLAKLEATPELKNWAHD